ncbi:MAG: hypothetical protein K1Y01_14620 [Vicinamibacteria bacterium]|nr:hypothetical protein [Vicinamibacteria bacterium]
MALRWSRLFTPRWSSLLDRIGAVGMTVVDNGGNCQTDLDRVFVFSTLLLWPS